MLYRFFKVTILLLILFGYLFFSQPNVVFSYNFKMADKFDRAEPKTSCVSVSTTQFVGVTMTTMKQGERGRLITVTKKNSCVSPLMVRVYNCEGEDSVVESLITCGFNEMCSAGRCVPEFLVSNFFKDDITAKQIVASSSTYNMDTSEFWQKNVINRASFSFKILSALHMLGYETRHGYYKMGNPKPQVFALNYFKKRHGMTEDGLMDKKTLLAMDVELAAKEKKWHALGQKFPLSIIPNPNGVSADYIGALYSFPINVLPPYLHLDSTEMFNCIAGQCVGLIYDKNGKEWSSIINSLVNLEYSFEAVYLNGNRSIATYPDGATTVETVLHEYAHYLDGFHKQKKFAGLHHYGIINTQGFHALSYDLLSRESGCYKRLSDDSKDFISRYGFVNNYSCPAGKYQIVEEFAEAFQMYVTSGKQFRVATVKNSVIAQKYNWLKDNVFFGTEYDTDLQQAAHSGCDDLPGLRQEPGYMECNPYYVWNGELPLKP